MTAIVLIAVLFIYGAIRHTVRVGIDKDLEGAAEVVLHRLDEDRYPINKELLDLGEHLMLRITDLEGKTLIETPGMTEIPSSLCSPGEGSTRFQKSIETRKGEAAKLLVSNWSGGWIQVLRVHQSEDDLLSRLRRLLVAVVGIAPLLSGGLGYLLTRWNLRPVRNLAERTQAIDARTLKVKLPLVGVPGELVPLVQGINTALERLDHAFTRLGELNGDMAHELRTPLHGMRLELEALMDRTELPETLQESLGRVIENLDYFSALIQQILFLAQAEDPNAHLRKESVSAAHLLDTAVAPYEFLAEERGIHLERAGGDFPIQGNPTLLRRVCHNLLGNAIRHTPAGGRVALIARQEGDLDVLEVVDSGSGIPASAIEHLGQRFFRVDPSRNTATGGTGLGLAIVKGIAQVHGGSFFVQSEVGLGSRIGITLPRT